MQNPKLCKKLLETILGIEIEKIEYSERQKPIDITKDAKGVWLDVYVSGGNKIFCVEMQAQDTHELPSRTRYYGDLIDLNLIEKGVSYKKLSQNVVIFICTFDVYGKGRHRYTFENVCLEDRDLCMGDGDTYKRSEISWHIRSGADSVHGKSPVNNPAASLMPRCLQRGC